VAVALDAGQWVLVGLFAVCLVGLVRSVRRPAAAAAPSAVAAAGPEQWWRCESCKRRWRSAAGPGGSAWMLRLRRRARRRARTRGEVTPEWARARGSLRCPSCLSTDVRPSRQQD
jgi:hypothetical protein